MNITYICRILLFYCLQTKCPKLCCLNGINVILGDCKHNCFTWHELQLHCWETALLCWSVPNSTLAFMVGYSCNFQKYIFGEPLLECVANTHRCTCAHAPDTPADALFMYFILKCYHTGGDWVFYTEFKESLDIWEFSLIRFSIKGYFQYGVCT